MEKLSQCEARLLDAAQMAYRKHHLGDDSIGWDELSDILLSAICDAMTDKGYQQWLKSLKRQGDHQIWISCKSAGYAE